jgi:hypothetical protein
VTHEWFELRRQSDELIYLFQRERSPDGNVRYRRQDRDIFIRLMPNLGWVSWDENTHSCTGRPRDVLPSHQTRDHPPEGIWVSRKGIKSYVYALAYVVGPRVPFSE